MGRIVVSSISRRTGHYKVIHVSQVVFEPLYCVSAPYLVPKEAEHGMVRAGQR